MARILRVLLAAALASAALAGTAQAQPNVLLIVTDDQRWDSLPYLPAIQEELVGRGVTFSNAFTVNPLCCPSRATILTGTYAHTHTVWANNGTWSAPSRLNRQWHLGAWLQAAGYRTGLFGKFFNNWGWATGIPAGWDRWVAFNASGNGRAYFDYELDVDGALVTLGSAETDYSTDVLADAAEAFVRADAPFFAYVAPFAPHLPTIPAPRHANATFGVTADYPLQYLRTLLAVDDLVGQLVDALEETGELENTVVIFTSDNGMHLGEHGLMAKKETPYEESIRVPLVVRYDALGLPAHGESAMVANVDLAQTILELAGVAVAHPFEGRSFAPLLRAEPYSARTSLPIEFYGLPGRASSFCQIRGQRWSYAQYADGRESLWDILADPGQANDLAGTADTRLLIDMRYRVRRSNCRPPGFVPKRLCTLLGSRSEDRIVGTQRVDAMCAEGGDDAIWSRDDRRETIRCGPGTDRAYVDPVDRTIGCELVRRRVTGL